MMEGAELAIPVEKGVGVGVFQCCVRSGCSLGRWGGYIFLRRSFPADEWSCRVADAQLLAVVEERFGAGGEEEGRDELGDGNVVLAVPVPAHAAFVSGAVGREERQAVAGLQDVLQGLDGWTNDCRIEGGASAGTRVQDELRELRIGGSVGSLAKVGCKCGVGVCDDDALAEIAAGSFAECGGLGVRVVVGAGDVETSDAAVEPEACDVGKVG